MIKPYLTIVFSMEDESVDMNFYNEKKADFSRMELTHGALDNKRFVELIDDEGMSRWINMDKIMFFY